MRRFTVLNTVFTFCSITLESSNAYLSQYAKYHEKVSKNINIILLL